MVLFCVQCCVCRKLLSSPRCRSELIDSAWAVNVPGQKCIKKNDSVHKNAVIITKWLLYLSNFSMCHSSKWISISLTNVQANSVKPLIAEWNTKKGVPLIKRTIGIRDPYAPLKASPAVKWRMLGIISTAIYVCDQMLI